MKADLVFPFGDLLIFGETWLEHGENQTLNTDNFSDGVLPTNYNQIPANRDSSLELPGYKLHLNSRGRGKGLAAYYNEKFNVTQSICSDLLQITVLEANDICVISIYRSHGDKSLNTQLSHVIPKTGSCLIIGDLNICSSENNQHEVFTVLRSMGFQLMISEATHFLGRKIDQAWLRSSPNTQQVAHTSLYSPYFNAKDHDSILVTFCDPNTEKGEL